MQGEEERSAITPEIKGAMIVRMGNNEGIGEVAECSMVVKVFGEEGFL
jgi:hypothetical protein